jgi:hypothetical protein
MTDAPWRGNDGCNLRGAVGDACSLESRNETRGKSCRPRIAAQNNMWAFFVFIRKFI